MSPHKAYNTYLDMLAWQAFKAATIGADDRVIKVTPEEFLVDPTSGLSASAATIATPEPKKSGPWAWTFDPPTGPWLSATKYDPKPRRRRTDWRTGSTVAEGWDFWLEQRSIGGNPLKVFRVGRLEAHISWGETRDHVRPGDWGKDAKWYVDLEVEGRDGTDLACCGRSGLVGHVERGFPTRALAEGAVVWLRSCVEVAGLAGLLALNARSGGALA